MKSVLKWFYLSAPLVSRSDWSGRKTESENGSGPLQIHQAGTPPPLPFPQLYWIPWHACVKTHYGHQSACWQPLTEWVSTNNEHHFHTPPIPTQPHFQQNPFEMITWKAKFPHVHSSPQCYRQRCHLAVTQAFRSHSTCLSTQVTVSFVALHNSVKITVGKWRL